MNKIIASRDMVAADSMAVELEPGMAESSKATRSSTSKLPTRGARQHGHLLSERQRGQRLMRFQRLLQIPLFLFFLFLLWFAAYPLPAWFDVDGFCV